MKPLDRIVLHFGNRPRVAKALGLSPSAVYHWQRIPANHCRELSRMTGIPLAELRADLYAEDGS